MKRVPVVYSDDFLTEYDTVDCENPERVAIIHFIITGIADFTEPEPCTIDDLERCHSTSLIQSVRNEGEVFEVARKSAGGAVKAAEIALVNPGFALIRPPGHHAGYNFNGGFCFFNNMAIAVTKLLAAERIRSALIIDIDLHYGNGTHDIVNKDTRISFRNIESRSREQFFEDLEHALRDAAEFDIIGCSAGFDTYIRDWGGLLLTDDYRRIGNRIVSSNRHTFAILEGGYYIDDLGKNVASFLKGMQEACL